MSDSTIIELVDVTADALSASMTALRDVSFALEPGQMLLLEPERHVETVPLYDVICGLIEPTRGRVLFAGREWGRMSLYRQSAERQRIGRVFGRQGWVSNLSVFENIVLAQRHHTTRPDVELRRAVEALAERVGVRECLAERPHALSPGVLRRAQWVRALLGPADLLLLEDPLASIRADYESELFALLADARERGGTVIWTAADVASRSESPAFDGALRGRVRDGRVLLD